MAYSAEERSVIYALVDPRDGRVRYIGKAKDAQKRLKGHLRETRRRSPLYSWIASLKKQGLKPSCEILETCDGDWCESEKRLIAQYRKKFSDLLNLADGGDEPHCPIEIRRENAKKLKEIFAADPVRKRAKELNQYLSVAFKRGELQERHLTALRLAAEKAPRLFGMWATV